VCVCVCVCESASVCVCVCSRARARTAGTPPTSRAGVCPRHAGRALPGPNRSSECTETQRCVCIVLFVCLCARARARVCACAHESVQAARPVPVTKEYVPALHSVHSEDPTEPERHPGVPRRIRAAVSAAATPSGPRREHPRALLSPGSLKLLAPGHNYPICVHG
jgi:hypothetical protein